MSNQWDSLPNIVPCAKFVVQVPLCKIRLHLNPGSAGQRGRQVPCVQLGWVSWRPARMNNRWTSEDSRNIHSESFQNDDTLFSHSTRWNLKYVWTWTKTQDENSGHQVMTKTQIYSKFRSGSLALKFSASHKHPSCIPQAVRIIPTVQQQTCELVWCKRGEIQFDNLNLHGVIAVCLLVLLHLWTNSGYLSRTDSQQNPLLLQVKLGGLRVQSGAINTSVS